MAAKGKAFTNYLQYLQTATTRTFARAERFEVSFNVAALVRNNEMNGGRLENRIGQGAASELLEGDISLFCEEVQIPGMILSNKEFNVGAWTFFRNTKVGFLGNEINFTFVTPNDWDLRGFFEQWIKECADTTSQELGYIDAVTTTIDIKALDLEDNVTKYWTLYEAMPKVLNLVPLSSGTTSAIRNTLIVSAAYWESSDGAISNTGLKSFNENDNY